MYEEKISIDQTNQEAVWILQPHSSLPKEKEAFKKEAKRRAKIQSTPNPYDYESRIWQLTYNMGAQILNRSELQNESKFWITGTNQNTQQIDVFAVVRDYALIIECTTSISKENIRTKINDINDYKKAVSEKIDKIFTLEGGKKLKKLFILAVKDWNISQQDLNTYTEDDLRFLPKQETEYLEQVYANSGNKIFTANQFFGFLAKDFEGDEKKFFAIKNNLGRGVSYTFSAKPKDMISSCVIAHRKAEGLYADRTASEGYYQRILKKKRLSEVSKFLINKDSSFVDSILLGYRGTNPIKFKKISDENVKDENGGVISIKFNPGSFHVIDGQHRLFGYTEPISEDLADNHNLSFTILDEMEVSDEATYFVDINSGHKPIDKSLLQEVSLVTMGETTENLATAIAIECRENSSSPFRNPDLINPSESKSRNFNITAINDGLKKENFFQKGNDEEGNAWKKGLFAAADFGYTKEIYTEFIFKCFDIIKTELPEFWRPKDDQMNNLAHQIIVAGLIKLFIRFVEKNNFAMQEKNPRKIFSHIKEDIEFLINKIKESNSSDLDEIFQMKSFLGASGPNTWRAIVLYNYFKDDKNFEHIYERKVDEPLVEKLRRRERIAADFNELQEKNKNLLADIERKDKEIRELKKKDKTDPDKFYINEQSVKVEGQIKSVFHLICKIHLGDNYFDYLMTLKSLDKTMSDVQKIELDMKRDTTSDEHPTGQTWNVKLSYCNLVNLRDIFLNISKLETIDKNKVEKCKSELKKYISIPHPDENRKKDADSLEYLKLLNKLRRYGGAHRPVEDEDAKNSKKDIEEFNYYESQIMKNIRDFKKEAEALIGS